MIENVEIGECKRRSEAYRVAKKSSGTFVDSLIITQSFIPSFIRTSAVMAPCVGKAHPTTYSPLLLGPSEYPWGWDLKCGVGIGKRVKILFFSKHRHFLSSLAEG
uniref:Uncharacterized protein n=1 Tax=Chenopodium quinoa TaxID=63459 RepID=A0A803KRZ0_CHEQI